MPTILNSPTRRHLTAVSPVLQQDAQRIMSHFYNRHRGLISRTDLLRKCPEQVLLEEMSDRVAKTLLDEWVRADCLSALADQEGNVELRELWRDMRDRAGELLQLRLRQR